MADKMISYAHYNDPKGVRFSQFAYEKIPAWAVDVKEYIQQNSTEEFDTLRAEVAAWRKRFPQYVFRPQDDCIALKHGT